MLTNTVIIPCGDSNAELVYRYIPLPCPITPHTHTHTHTPYIYAHILYVLRYYSLDIILCVCFDISIAGIDIRAKL